jgi:hypothetical protein
VERAQSELGLDQIQLLDLGGQRRPAQRSCGADALETVDDLQPAQRPEQGERGQLTVLLERALHRTERRRFAQPQGGEALAEPGDLDRLQLNLRLPHASLEPPRPGPIEPHA